jgi:FPC/CPF motif-containing protein YcgG
MGRPIGSSNRERPFTDALRIALRADPRRLRRIAEKLAEKAEDGDLAAIRELADRLDGKPPQAHTGEYGGDLTVVIRQLVAL